MRALTTGAKQTDKSSIFDDWSIKQITLKRRFEYDGCNEMVCRRYCPGRKGGFEAVWGPRRAMPPPFHFAPQLPRHCSGRLCRGTAAGACGNANANNEGDSPIKEEVVGEDKAVELNDPRHNETFKTCDLFDGLMMATLSEDGSQMDATYHGLQCSVDFVSAPFLIQESSFKRANGSIETLKLDLMDPATSMYHDADLIVFNTGKTITKKATTCTSAQSPESVSEGSNNLVEMGRRKRQLQSDSGFLQGILCCPFWGGQWNSGGKYQNSSHIPQRKQAHRLPESVHPSIYRGNKTEEDGIARWRFKIAVIGACQSTRHLERAAVCFIAEGWEGNLGEMSKSRPLIEFM
ncbi:hypothetical protein F3Y22_tig00109972pilonHSYRG00412 [Hibiscus syriacus]|uniref:Trichome birefringence-like C-terminal domain-containing protein n=1 Tax=Hibiscus syriacus TaxID=106335 RepID=A0A6A3BV69_HIBSY|nr:hypothetical protein F3Y22_tig00109972pilonHSYRG00412 [Hibiscus syriacus]